jgi:hypothetical protein
MSAVLPASTDWVEALRDWHDARRRAVYLIQATAETSAADG